MEQISDELLDRLIREAEQSTPRPWYFRPGTHTQSTKSSMAGALRVAENDEAVLLPVSLFVGPWEPDHEHGVMRPSALALELVGKTEDLRFIEHAMNVIEALAREVKEHRARRRT